MPARTPHPKNHEVEVKIRFDGTARAARARIERCGYKMIERRTLEADQLYDRAGELKSSDRALRLRRAGRIATVTYKGPGERKRHKSREEIEFEVSKADEFELVLERLGYHPAFKYEKFRTKFAKAADKGIVTVDETPIGVFLEIEGPPEWIDRTAIRLGYSHDEYLTCSYASLYRNYRVHRKSAPANMVFPSKRGFRTT